nr:class I SAM-dependent methyltransferase [Acidimicrobiia bacterium]
MDQREIWDDLVGDAWVRNADIIDKHSAPFGEAAMERLGTVAGASVLDVGCGTGTTTRELARRGASAVGIDLSARMVAHARTLNAAGSGADFEVGDVTALAPAEPFDAVYSRFGVMFFDDAVAAFRHIRTVVRSGGRLGFSAWAGPFENPWMTTAVLASIRCSGYPRCPVPTSRARSRCRPLIGSRTSSSPPAGPTSPLIRWRSKRRTLLVTSSPW